MNVSIQQVGNLSGTVQLQGKWIEHEPTGIAIDISPAVGTPPFTSVISFHSSLYTNPGSFHYELTASSENKNSTTKINVNITTDLIVRVLTEKVEYLKGQQIHLSGNATMNQMPVSSGDVYILLQTPRRNISLTSSLQNQSFDYVYPISYGDDEGRWMIQVKIIDNQRHVGIQTKNITVSVPSDIMRYVVGFFSPPNKAVYQRGDSLTVSVYVTEDLSNVQNATTTCLLPSSEKIPLLEYTPGYYKQEYTIPWDIPTGESFFIVESIKNISGTLKAGGSAVSIYIEPAPLQLAVLEPKSVQFSPNSNIPLSIEVRYLDGTVVASAQVIAKTPAGNITLMYQQYGIYKANISISNQNIGNQIIDITSMDSYGNTGSVKQLLLITSETSLPITSTLIPLSIAGICGVFGIYFFRRFYRLKRLKVIREEMIETRRLQEDAVNKYYKEGVISRQVYDALIYEHAQRYAHLQKEERKISRK
jgi:hypothetical protein